MSFTKHTSNVYVQYWHMLNSIFVILNSTKNLKIYLK